MKYSLKEVFAFTEAWLLLHFSKSLIVLIPFRYIAAQLGKKHYETENTTIEQKYWSHIEIAIVRAARFTFYKSRCFDQAITGKIMLKRRGVPTTLYLGILKEQNNLEAHAWLSVGASVVTGKIGMERYTPIVWFGDQEQA